MTRGFIAENWKLRLLKHPIEDAFNIDPKVGAIAVADGITRDPMSYLPNMKTLGGKLSFVWNYPRPSPAKRAADLFCETFPAALMDFGKDENGIIEAFRAANRQIKEWNHRTIPYPNYTINDFAGCVSAGTVQDSKDKNIIHWGYIADCGLSVIDEKGNVIFKTKDDGPSKYDKHIWASDRLKGLNWRDPDARRIVRSMFRNNPEEEHSYGALTGETGAMPYINTGTIELRPIDILLVYSDGVEEILFNKEGDINGEAADKIKNRDFRGLEKLCRRNVRNEGTLVYSTN